MKKPPSALWLVRKPRGATSTSMLDEFRRAHAGNFTLKLSHGGALDPFAEGLLIILVGAANRLFEALHEVPKRYVARVEWGVETDTCDAGGRELARGETSALTPERLDAALASFRGWTDQVPPATSNKRVDGERAWARAHRGEAVTLPAQPVFLHEARWLEHRLTGERPHSRVELSVRGGFYVRSLARDLGRALGVGAHLSTLERTAIGPWSTPREPESVSGARVLPWLPSIVLDDAQWGALRQGTRPPLGAPTPPSWPLPAGFPEARAGVRCFHLGRLVALISGERVTLLPGGI
ncbi:MAG: tRNA pseudouridine(55) synthase TruB [Myxococcota bacterium]